MALPSATAVVPDRADACALSEARVWPGRPYPLGATWDGHGVNLAVYSEHATRIEWLLFDGAYDPSPSRSVILPEHTGPVWHGYLPDVGPSQLYGLRVHGPWDPSAGHRFNPAKVVLDPYARAIGRPLRWHQSLMGSQRRGNEELPCERDSAPYAALGAVVDDRFDWQGVAAPRVPWEETIIYETHVRGISMLHPDVPEAIRGTYLGLASEPVLAHLRRLGITTVQLQPVQSIAEEQRLYDLGLTNYWGYNTLNYFAPEPRYSSNGPVSAVDDFKTMVRELHRAGFEVIIDVVYNHTGEGNHTGPTLSLRGIDNLAYYKLQPHDPRFYIDYTGTGNTLDPGNPYVLQLITDSLRYWVSEMHVDGFRFDLASALAREFYDVNMLSAFFKVIQQDPVLSRVKLIAEPWDVGPGGYQVGSFPWTWTEWNGKYRDTVRDFWRGESAVIGETATRLSGSSDLYEGTGRRPYASINFITAHDGFTLRDLVSYHDKHNEANLDDNTSGEDHNRSYNHGVEGPTDDPAVNALRIRQQRNFLATLFLSQGVPMLLGGDEFGRSQEGNNNAFCQDNELTWYDWSWTGEQAELMGFTSRLIALRKTHPVLRRQQWFRGYGQGGMVDLDWLKPDAEAMTEEDWETIHHGALMFFLNGQAIPNRDARGRPITDDSFLVMLNARGEDLEFKIPPRRYGTRWRVVLDTTSWHPKGRVRLRANDRRAVTSRSLVLLQASDPSSRR